MKKTALLIFALLITITTSGQKVEWTQMPGCNNDFVFSCFYKITADNLYALFAEPQSKYAPKPPANCPFQVNKSEVLLAHISNDYTSLKEIYLPEDAPLNANVLAFKDYDVLYGSMESNLLKTTSEQDNRVVILDKEGKTVLSRSFSVKNNTDKFEGCPVVRISEDENRLIIVNTVKIASENSGKKNDRKVSYVNIYDDKLSQIWSDSIDLQKVFGESTVLNQVQYCFAFDKLFVVGFQSQNPMAKLKPAIFVACSEKPGINKVIIHETFEYGVISWNCRFGSNGMMCIGGVQSVGQSKFTKGKQSLFMICKNIVEKKEDGKMKMYKVDETLLTRFPEIEDKDNLKLIGTPGNFIVNEDGILYFSEDNEEYMNKEHLIYFYNFVSLIKYDFTGEIKWIRLLKKKIACQYNFEGVKSRLIQQNGTNYMLYYDYEPNIMSETFIKKSKVKGVGSGEPCLVLAEIDNEGNLDRKLVFDQGKGGYAVALYNARFTNDGTLLLPFAYEKMNTKKKAFCIGTYKPD